MDEIAKKKWTYVPLSSNPDMKLVKCHFFETAPSQSGISINDDVDDHEKDYDWRDHNTVFHDDQPGDQSDFADQHSRNHADRRTTDGFVILFSDLDDVFLCRSSLAEMKAKNSLLNSRLTVASDQHLIANVENCLRAFCPHRGSERKEGTKSEEKRRDRGRLYEVRFTVIQNTLKIGQK